MGFIEKTKNFLGIASTKTVESLSEELKIQELLLEKSTEQLSASTGVSFMAKETKVSEDPQNVISKRVSIKELQGLYMNNQFIFRGVNVRADELVTRGYKLIGGDEEGRKVCQQLIDNSGGTNLFWQLSVNTDVCGDGYLEKVRNIAGNKIVILKHLNPLNFGFLTYEEDNTRIVLTADNIPKAYMQIVSDEEGTEVRKEINKDKISHLRFNTFADEFKGISSLQPVYNTSIRLMNMEHAAAEAAVKTANPTWVVETETKSVVELAKWAKVLGKVSAKEVVFLPNGVKVKLESPGTQNFSAYSDYFLDAVVSALGVPKSILTGSGGSDGSNRATTQTLSKHFYSVIRSNQRYIELEFNEIFKEYAEIAGFDAPRLVFEDIAEDADRNGQRAVELYQNDLVTLEEARNMVGLETSPNIKKELELKNIANNATAASTAKIDNKDDMNAFHGPEPGSPAGSQKNNKKKQKLNPDVPSVR